MMNILVHLFVLLSLFIFMSVGGLQLIPLPMDKLGLPASKLPIDIPLFSSSPIEKLVHITGPARDKKYNGKGGCTKQPTSSKSRSRFKIENQPYCSAAIAYLGYGVQYPGPSARDPDLFPDWINITLAVQGQEQINENIFSITLGSWYGIAASLMYSHLAEVLLHAGGNIHGTPQKRYVATMNQLALWSRGIFSDKSNKQSVIRSITNTRKLHLNAGRAARKKMEVKKRQRKDKVTKFSDLGNEEKYKDAQTRDYLWEAVKKDMDLHLPEEFRTFLPSYTNTLDEAVAMSQFDFAIVQWSTIGLLFLGPEKIHIYDLTDEELWAINHFWAVLGYALGIDDTYNVCLQPTLKDQKKYFRDLFDYYVSPAIYSPSKPAKVLIELVANAFAGADIPHFGNKTADFALENFFKRFLMDFMEFPSTPHLDAVSSEETLAFREFYVNVFLPFSRLPASREVLNKIMEGMVAELAETYFHLPDTSDETISKRAFHPSPNTDEHGWNMSHQ